MAIIECKLGAEEQTFDGVEYKFRRDNQGRYVALVHNHEHVAGFLASPVYRSIDSDDQAEAEFEAEVETEEMFKDETDEQIAARLQREQEERDALKALQEQNEAQAAESAKITEAIAADKPIDLDVDPHTAAQMPTVDPTRASEDAVVDAGEDDEDQEIIMADDLTEIKGIGPSVQDLLNECEIFTYEDIANLTDEQAEELNDKLNLKNTIHKFEWRQRAKELMQD